MNHPSNQPPWYEDHDITIYNQDAYTFAKTLPTNHIDCIVTSPPYWKLRDYNSPQQWGRENTIGEYVDHLVTLFAMLRPKIKNDATIWLNLGDTRLDRQACGIPWRVAHDLQADGWHIRQDIIWVKPNAMPESVDDRPAGNYEHVFLISKTPHHRFNLDPIRVQYDGDRAPSRRARSGHTNKPTSATAAWSGDHPGRNPGSVWSIPVQPFKDAHSAVMPMALAERCVLAGSSVGDVVCDPFHGSGTTAAAALKLGRRYVGTDVSEEYLRLSLRTRLKNGALPLFT